MQKLKNLILSETFPGILLVFFIFLALFFKNSSLSSFYTNFFETQISPDFAAFHFPNSALKMINDGLISIFFFSIGLELKYEILRGQLKNIKALTLPIFGALGGMILPALIFTALNFNDATALRGWAIPTATDIAFALGILMLLGKSVPNSLKLFLLTLAIFDDLGAILIVAFFYTKALNFIFLAFCALIIFSLFILNKMKISSLLPYIFLGFFLWFCMLQSGIHATLCGVILAIFIPLECDKACSLNSTSKPVLKPLLAKINPFVVYLILPLFAFANAGVDLKNMSFSNLFSSVSLGVFFGLFLGKQLGVFIASFLAVKFRLAAFPIDVSRVKFYGICVLTGIGFTMSLFIDTLAYENPSLYSYADRLAILLASFCSAICGYFYLKFVK